jgi:glycosyltransferase involved in cell wall biosynthesis
MSGNQPATADIRPRPRSVVVLTPWFPNRPNDSRFTYIYDSAAALARRGVAVHVLVCRPFTSPLVGYFTPERMPGTIELAAFGELAGIATVHYLGLPRGWLRPLTNSLMFRRICPVLKSLALRSGAELIHAQTEGMAPVAAAVAAQLGLPSVVTVHGLNTDPHFLHAPRQRAMFRRAMGTMDRVILVGEPLRPFFSALVGGDDHFRVVHNGARLPADPDRAAILRYCEPTRFISVSNLQEGKGIDIALRALAMARDEGLVHWDYTIVGDGGEHRALAELAWSLGLTEQVRFLGEQPHERIYGLLCQADVFILPSYREAFGIAYLEAMAAGLVTIGTRGQGPEAFIEHGKSGFLVEPRSPRSVADCILGIAARPEAARQVAAAGADLVWNRFTWDAHASRLLEVYQELVG